jgi:hypothetical protein
MLSVLISYTITPFLICLLKSYLRNNNLVLSFLRSEGSNIIDNQLDATIRVY